MWFHAYDCGLRRKGRVIVQGLIRVSLKVINGLLIFFRQNAPLILYAKYTLYSKYKIAGYLKDKIPCKFNFVR